jgi:hypothetical protein
MRRVEVFKKTHDSWYPEWSLYIGPTDMKTGLVQVSFLQLSDGMWRVCCWGADDMGLERDYETEAEAWNVFLQVIGWSDVSQSRLKKELEFYPA